MLVATTGQECELDASADISSKVDLINLPGTVTVQQTHSRQTVLKRGSAGHFPIFWDCPIVSSLWEKVVRELKIIINSNIEFKFSVVRLGNFPIELSKQNKYSLQILLAGSKKAFTSRWLSDEPNHHFWIERIEEIYTMERLTFSRRRAREKCERYWRFWRSYIKGFIYVLLG